jgi:NAD(P)-dependent dehydrogenase (short-subunit alcohol dehydrogenase family)
LYKKSVTAHIVNDLDIELLRVAKPSIVYLQYHISNMRRNQLQSIKSLSVITYLSSLNKVNPTGTVVIMTSGVGGMIIPGMSSYSIAKYAGDRFTEYLDAEYPHLRAFALSPGIPHTTLTRDSFKPFAKDHADLPGMICLYLS